MKTISKLLIFMLTVCIILTSFVSNIFAAKPEIASSSAVLIDVDSMSVLYEKNANQKMAPASTTKVMTLLLVAENAQMDEKVKVDSSVFASLPHDATIAYFAHGETTTVEALFMASYLMSANDAALILANHVGTDVDGCVKMMNDRAKELGCKSTNFTNPTGLYSSEHYTTASDLALITKAFYENETVKKLIAKKEYTIPSGPMRPDPFPLKVTNGLMSPENPNYYPSVVLSKTGYTEGSKYTLVAVANKDNRTLLSVSLCAPERNDSYSDIRKLSDHGFADFYSLTVTKTEIENLFSSNKKHTIKVAKDVKLTIPTSVPRDSIRKSVEVANGQAYLSVKGTGYDYSVKISDVAAKKGGGGFFGALFGGIWWLIKTLFMLVLYLVIIVVVLYLILVIYINALKKKRRKVKSKRTYSGKM